MKIYQGGRDEKGGRGQLKTVSAKKGELWANRERKETIRAPFRSSGIICPTDLIEKTVTQ